MHPEVRRRGHRVVGAVARAEQRHRRQDRRAEQQPEQGRQQRVAERQPEDDREAAEHDGGDGVGATEHQPEQVERTGGALGVGDRFDAVRLDLGDLRGRLERPVGGRGHRGFRSGQDSAGTGERCSWTASDAVAVEHEDDGLAFARGAELPADRGDGVDGVTEHGGVAERLHQAVAARARHHPPSVVEPGRPQGFVGSAVVQSGGLWVEHEGRIGGEAGEVRRGVGGRERRDERIGRCHHLGAGQRRHECS